MEEYKKKNQLFLLLIFFVILSFILIGFICYEKWMKEDKCKAENLDKVVKVSDDVNKNVDVDILTEEIQELYGKVYDLLGEGYEIREENPVTIQIGKEDTVGGIKNVQAYRMDFSQIESYFIKRGLDFIKFYFTDTPYGHTDGHYYIYTNENNILSDRSDFITTIFGETDQSKRELKIKSYSEDMVVAVSEKTSFLELDEYIVFKKVDGSWKIDMFEQF